MRIRAMRKSVINQESSNPIEKFFLNRNMIYISEESIIKYPKISLLVNSFLFFLDTVFILYEKDDFRLIVLHDYKVLADKFFPTLEEAKQSFLNNFKYKAYEKYSTPCWWDDHMVENEWVKNHLKKIKRCRGINIMLKWIDKLMMQLIYQKLKK
jgi:hypothetical protein